jgi:hypothetical protein
LTVDVIVVDQTGDSFGTVDNAEVGKVTWELNAPGGTTISLSTTDADIGLLQPGREVQVWLDGSILWWGVIARPQKQLRQSSWQCSGLLWYFDHRFMGRADRINLLTNGDFEAGETGWTFNNGVTHSVETTEVLEGTQSLELEGSVANHDEHALQTYNHTVQWHPAGDLVTVSAWVYIPSADYLGGAVEDFGLVARRRNSAGEVLDAQWETGTIGDSTVKDLWIPLEVAIPNVVEADMIDVLLFPPHGIAYYDLVTLTLMESLSFGETDVAAVLAGIVDYAQDNGPFIHGKSDLNIGTAGSATGVVISRAYQFAEHRNIGDALREFVRDGIVDIDIEITPTTRTFTTYTPAKGSLYGTTLELDVNLADFTWSWDGDNGASSVVLTGPGDGPDRPEGGATDPAFVGGAFTAEIVESAPDDTTVGQLDSRAVERLVVAARPEIFQVVTMPGAGIIGDLAVGDTVPVVIDLIGIDDIYRVTRIEADLYRDQATITLNPVPA